MTRAARNATRGVVALGAVVAMLLLWGLLVEPRRIGMEREVATVPGLPAAWDGQQIAVIADLQVGMWGANTGTARRIVGRLVGTPPAAVLIAGDFLYKADDDLAEHIAEAVRIVRPLPAAGIPTYAVLGNHDYSMDEKDDTPDTAMAERLRRALEQAGIRVLQNEAVLLALPAAGGGVGGSVGTAGADRLYLVGIGSHWANEDDPTAALAQVPRGAPRLVLMHNPASFEHLPAGSAPVALAAHTHGGQVRLPFTPSWSWLTFVKDESVHVDGWIEGRFGAPGNALYVNRGIGFSDVPMRMNATPELTLLTLSRSAPPPRTSHTAPVAGCDASPAVVGCAGYRRAARHPAPSVAAVHRRATAVAHE